MSAWIGVDLDGTLVKYDGWVGPEHIGELIPEMARRVREWLSKDREVRIFTARAFGPDRDEQIRIIEAWCERTFGQRLAVTCTKDFGMIELWDDRAVQVIPNTGKRADGQP